MVTSKPKLAALYNTDFQHWLDQTVAQLKAGNFHRVDLENLVEELESLGKRDRRSISSYLRRLCEHLLKVKYWEAERERCLRGWKVEIQNFRLEIVALLEDSPSLENHLSNNFEKEYQNGRRLFLNASELDPSAIPESPGFTLEQALSTNWLPL